MKRMLEVGSDGTMAINSSSVELIHTCRKKAYYALERNLRPKEESEALVFGTAIHKGLEAFYTAPIENGVRRVSEEDVHAAFTNAAQQLAHVDPSEKRSIENGKKILTKYMATYANDPWKVLTLSNGKPAVEVAFDLMTELPGIRLHGQIDCLLQNGETGEVVVCDHKTASTLGVDFFNRIKPNTQFSIYAWAARKLGYSVTKVMVNGIQVAKTKAEFVRVFTERTAEDDAEMMDSVVDAVQLFQTSREKNRWSINSASCSHYGGCQYRDLCSLSPVHRETAISDIWGARKDDTV